MNRNHAFQVGYFSLHHWVGRAIYYSNNNNILQCRAFSTSMVWFDLDYYIYVPLLKFLHLIPVLFNCFTTLLFRLSASLMVPQDINFGSVKHNFIRCNLWKFHNEGILFRSLRYTHYFFSLSTCQCFLLPYELDLKQRNITAYIFIFPIISEYKKKCNYVNFDSPQWKNHMEKSLFRSPSRGSLN